MIVIHDLAYADLVFDRYKAPGILETPGARERAVEFFLFQRAITWQAGASVFASETAS